MGGALSFLRSPDYSTAEISYNYENSYYKWNFIFKYDTVNFVGYMGFTASTGGSTDVHSVRDVTIYADIADADAGTDISICGRIVQIIPQTPEFLYFLEYRSQFK